MTSSFSDSTNEAIQGATNVNQLADLDYNVPGLPPLPPTGQFDVPRNQITRIDMRQKLARRDCNRWGCTSGGFDDSLGIRDVFGSFRIEVETRTVTTPVFSRYADGSVRSTGTVLLVENLYYLYEDFPQFAPVGTRFRVAGISKNLSSILFDPATSAPNQVNSAAITFFSATFNPPLPPIPPPDDDDGGNDDDDDNEPVPPCDIPITSNFDSGYFCMTFEEYNRFINDINRVEENLRRFNP